MLSELTALVAFVLAGYGAYIAWKWDRMASHLMPRAMAFFEKAQAAFNVPGPDGKPLPPLQATVSVGSSVLVNAAYALFNDPELMAKAMPHLKEMAPQLVAAYAQGSAQGEVAGNPGHALNKVRWADRGGKVGKFANHAAQEVGLGGPMAKLMGWVELAKEAKDSGILDMVKGFTAKGAGNGGQGAPAASGGSYHGGGTWPGGAL